MSRRSVNQQTFKGLLSPFFDSFPRALKIECRPKPRVYGGPGSGNFPRYLAMFDDSTAYLFLAMAQQRQGRVEDARESLSKARLVADQKFPKVDQGQLIGIDEERLRANARAWQLKLAEQA